MRRALRSIVPREVLMRRRKAYVVYGPLVALRSASDRIEELIGDSVAVASGFVDREALLQGLHRILGGQETRHLPSLINTLLFDIWLRTAPNLHPHSDLRADVKSSARQHVRAESSVGTD
jgi:asparagine synthase (glutamine-hydrolysing)